MESNTINKLEIAKFSKIAAEWWSPNGKFKPLHKFNPIRIKYLKENKGFKYLIDLCGVDYLNYKPKRKFEERFEVVYHLYNLDTKQLLRIKVRIPEEDCWHYSVTSLWKTANWFERECYDMYGIRFEGHPDLRRVLMPPDWEGYPLRKDFPLTGHNEVRYSEDEKKVIYEPVKLEQNYRNFDYESPWEGTKYIKEQTKK